eukprot:scaffold2936_cov25-Tisochrysis_lutea.AAC.1
MLGCWAVSPCIPSQLRQESKVIFGLATLAALPSYSWRLLKHLDLLVVVAKVSPWTIAHVACHPELETCIMSRASACLWLVDLRWRVRSHGIGIGLAPGPPSWGVATRAPPCLATWRAEGPCQICPNSP